MTDTATITQDIDVTIDLVTCKCGEHLDFTLSVDRNNQIDILVDEHECEQKDQD